MVCTTTSCILISCIFNDMAWILIMQCYRVTLPRNIPLVIYMCLVCTLGDTREIKTRYCTPYQEKALHNYDILNHAKKNTEVNTVNNAIDKDWVNTSRLMFSWAVSKVLCCWFAIVFWFKRGKCSYELIKFDGRHRWSNIKKKKKWIKPDRAFDKHLKEYYCRN